MSQINEKTGQTISVTQDYHMCSRCLYDTSIPDIRFDEQGICNFCHVHDELDRIYPLNEQGQAQLDNLVRKMKKNGRGKPYDCIIGLSGGRDSTCLLYTSPSPRDVEESRMPSSA